MTKSIPEIDISRLHTGKQKNRRVTAELLANACRDTGFFYIVGHGIDGRTIRSMREVTIELFELPYQDKLALSARPGDYRGYIPFAAFGNNANIEDVDHYEGYNLHREVAANDPIRHDCDLYVSNRWPPQVPEFQRVVLEYWRALDSLSMMLLRLFALALGLFEDRLLTYFVNSLTNMTLLHYPRINQHNTGSGIHPHRAMDAFTILYPGNEPGLELLTRAKRWIEVVPIKGAFVVNIGNMMELWSGGRFVSTPHRVTNPTGAQRHSFPYFAIPRHDVLIEPLVPRVDGFNKPAVEAGFVVRELYRTNWKQVARTDARVDVGTVE